MARLLQRLIDGPEQGLALGTLAVAAVLYGWEIWWARSGFGGLAVGMWFLLDGCHDMLKPRLPALALRLRLVGMAAFAIYLVDGLLWLL